MQVEVSKYTEGVNDKALRPNGLSKSLIRYDGFCFSTSFYRINTSIYKMLTCLVLDIGISSPEGESFGFHDRGRANNKASQVSSARLREQ